MAKPFKKILDENLPIINVPKPIPKKESQAGGAGDILVKTPAKEGIGVNPFSNISKLENLKSYSPNGNDEIIVPENSEKSLYGTGGEQLAENHSLLDDFNNSTFSELNKYEMVVNQEGGVGFIASTQEIGPLVEFPILNNTILGTKKSKFNDLQLSKIPSTGIIDDNGQTNNLQYDPRENTIKNPYEGSALDDLMNQQVFPFVAEDTDPLEVLYDTYKFDPRLDKKTTLPSGQNNITIGTNNPYKGTKFDDPLIDGLNGSGGVFNTSVEKYSSAFRNINKPTRYEIAKSGNIKDVQLGYISSLAAMDKFIETGGVLSDEDSSDILNHSPDIVIGNTPEGNGEISISNSSWFFSGTTMAGHSTSEFPNGNPLYQYAGSSEAGQNTRTNTIITTRLEGTRLGFDDLTFDSLYNKDHTAKFDDRLNIRYTNSGYRGDEPYVVYDVGADRGGESRSNPYKTWFKDNSRLVDFLSSDAGKRFSFSQLTYQWMFSHRNEKYWNPLSLFVGGQFNIANSILGIERHFGQPFLEGYTNTVYEEMKPGLLGAPNVIDDAILKVPNKINKWFGGWIGGNAFQVLGSNERGATDITNVSPGGSPFMYMQKGVNNLLSDIGKKMLENLLSFQTLDGGIGKKGHPRKLSYEEQRGFIFGKQLPAILFTNFKQPGSKLAGAPSLAGWKDPGDGFFPEDTSAKGKKGVNLKPYKNIPDGPLFRNFLETSSDEGEYESQARDKIPTSLDANTTYQFTDERNKDKSTSFSGTKWHRGDFFTNLPISPGKDLKDAYGSSLEADIESSKNGYPVYFKDLRDNSYLFFRGYLEGGITETVSSNWSGQSFLGRSEDTYIHDKTTRDISLTLKLFAQTKSELHAMYSKMEKLTSLCYPQFRFDDVNFKSPFSKLRSKPPLTKFRFADLYGSRNNELTGFIKSITYTMPDQSPWEHEAGMRVPKHMTANISYTVLHKESPNMLTKFYGKPQTSNIHYVESNDWQVLEGEK